ncbi:MAG: hypothetical protein ACYCYN_03045 [Solirubrobacteraceae bacterium]
MSAQAPIGCQLDLFVSDEQQGRTYPAVALLDRGTHCCECGCRHVYVRQMEPHVGAYCAGCGRWIKWLNKSERTRAQGGDV